MNHLSHPRTRHAPFLTFALVVSALSLKAAEFKFGEQTFTLPEGFIMERVAGPDLAPRPIEVDFDEQGHLYVTDSSGSNAPVTEQLKEKPHRILRLTDTNGDGTFDQTTVFADHMMFPEGCLWHDGSLYVSAPPVIWKLSDTNGDGKADKREEWLDAKTLTSCANDLHGPYLGLDGWIYWCKGAFAEQTWQQPDGTTLKSRASHIFRRPPEGGLVESVMTGGMDNPVGLAFTPEGERIFTCTFLQHPGGGKRDGIIHAIYGGVYGKVHDVIDGHPRTGDLMPVMTHLGPAAPCGIVRYESEILGSEFRNNLFVANFNLHKISRHQLRPQGVTYQTDDTDFLTCNSTDFHPTDVIEDADGSLLIVDTGGWYKICCPTSQLYKPDQLGAIYRIRRENVKKMNDPRGLKISWPTLNPPELVNLLADSRAAVVKRAIQELGSTSTQQHLSLLKSFLASTNPPAAKANAVWALTRIHDDSARATVRESIPNLEVLPQHAAIQSISVHRDWKAVSQLIPLLRSTNAPIRRATCEALGRLGNIDAVAPLLAAASELKPEPILPDRVQEHSIIYALIQLRNRGATRVGLKSANPFTQRAAMIALDQMDAAALSPADVIPLLDSPIELLKQTAQWIVSHRDDWNAELVAYFKTRLQSPSPISDDLPFFETELSKLAQEPAMQSSLAETAANELKSQSTRELALRAMAASNLKNPPESWAPVIAKLLSSPAYHSSAFAASTALYSKSSPELIQKALSQIALDPHADPEFRLASLNALPSSQWTSESFDFIRSQTDPAHSIRLRSLATSLLSKSRLNDDQLILLIENLSTAGPLEINHLFDAYEKSSSERVAAALIQQLPRCKSLAALGPDHIRKFAAKFSKSVQASSDKIIAQLDSDAPAQARHLEELLPKIKGGDIRRGQAIFNSTRAACSSCHAIGYIGGNLGPDLTRIGQVRTERDLLEAVVYPSASFVRSFEPMLVATSAGEEYSGLIKNDSGDEIVIATGPETNVRLARNSIAEIRPSRVSVMPQGFDQQLTTQELADLIAFLKSNR
jgi:putative membrane-bound dehydrogenase-like protein